MTVNHADILQLLLLLHFYHPGYNVVHYTCAHAAYSRCIATSLFCTDYKSFCSCSSHACNLDYPPLTTLWKCLCTLQQVSQGHMKSRHAELLTVTTPCDHSLQP